MLNKDPNFRDYVPFHGTVIASPFHPSNSVTLTILSQTLRVLPRRQRQGTWRFSPDWMDWVRSLTHCRAAHALADLNVLLQDSSHTSVRLRNNFP